MDEPRKRSSWGRFLLIWALALLILGAIGCFVLYRYLGVYEVTRPDALMEEFLQTTDAESLILQAKNNIQLDLTEFEDADALYNAYLDAIDISRPLSFRSLSTKDQSSEQLAYLVRAGAYNLCTVILEPEGKSPGFGRHHWKVSEVRSAPITEILPSVGIIVDALSGQQLYLNGHLITEEYLTEQGLPIEDLSPLEARMDPKPTRVRYSVSPLYGEISLTDAQGKLLSPLDDSNPSELLYSTASGSRNLTIQAPEDVEIRVNGVLLKESDITSSSYGILEGLEAYTLDGAYRTNTYTFSGLYAAPDVRATSPDGTELVPIIANDESWFFFYPNEEAVAEYLQPVADRFFNAYIQYTTRAYDATLFYNLISRVFPGTSLYSYISTTRETMAWAGSSNDEGEVEFDNFHQVSGTCFVCTVRYSVDRTSKYWFNEVSTTQEGAYELAFLSTSGNWFAGGMNIIMTSDE